MSYCARSLPDSMLCRWTRSRYSSLTFHPIPLPYFSLIRSSLLSFHDFITLADTAVIDSPTWITSQSSNHLLRADHASSTDRRIPGGLGVCPSQRNGRGATHVGRRAWTHAQSRCAGPQ